MSEKHELTDAEVSEHVATFKEAVAEHHAVGATRGAAAPLTGLPDSAYESIVRGVIPERPKGMGIQEWLALIAKIFAMIQNFFPPKPTPTP
jgi:hypothetical protein